MWSQVVPEQAKEFFYIFLSRRHWESPWRTASQTVRRSKTVHPRSTIRWCRV
jgi:hypothetical protein